MIDDRTKYDIGEPFISVRFSGGYIAHTPKGIVLSLDRGTRYTCTYSCLLSYLSSSSLKREEIEKTNIYDVINDFKKYAERQKAECDKRMKLIDEQIKNI